MKKNLYIGLAVLFLHIGLAVAKGADGGNREGVKTLNDDGPKGTNFIFSVTEVYPRERPEGEFRTTVISGLTADGGVVSNGQFVAKLDRVGIRKFMEKIENAGFFEKKLKRTEWTGMGSGMITIHAGWNGVTNRLSSWHEGFEKHGNLVVINGTAFERRGMSNEEAFAKSAEDYRRFRVLWIVVRGAASDLTGSK